jgi:hypothetical protein
MPLNAPVVGMAAASGGSGYWEVAADGGMFNYGSASFFGSRGGMPLNRPVVGMAAAPGGNGYWEVAADGGMFNYGSAGFFGSRGGMPLNAPVVGVAAAPGGGGYWEVAADGAIFNYGAAGFFGSMGGKHLNAPIVGMAVTPSGQGYWLVAADGGVFGFGDAQFKGSMGGKALNAPVVGMATAAPTSPPPPMNLAVYWDLFNAGTQNQLQFAPWPLTTSSPTTDISGNVGNNLQCTSGMTFDSSGRLWVISNPSGCSAPFPSVIQVFQPPVTQSSTPVLTFALPGTGDKDSLTFDSSGNLWVEDNFNSTVSEFSGPFTSSHTLTPALTLSTGINAPSGVAVDTSGSVYVANNTSSGTNSIAVFHTPVSASTVPTFLNGLHGPGGLIFDSQGNLYASSNPNVGASIVRYNSNNLGNGATPSIVDSAGLTGQPYEANFAWDALGNLYVADCGSAASVKVYPLSQSTFSSTLAPSVMYTNPAITSVNCVWGIAIR